MFSLLSWPRKAVGASLPLAAIALAGFAATAPGTGAAGAIASSPPPCTTSGIDIWFEPEIGGGTAGSIFYRFRFTNLSGHRCTLKGYPKVFAANLAGQRIGSAAGREGAGTPHTVNLAIGDTASALVRVTEAGNFSPSDCHPKTAAGFRVSPPGQTASRFVPFPFEACVKPGHSNLSIRAVKHEQPGPVG